MGEPIGSIDTILSFGIGGLCGYALTKVLKLRASATSLFVLTLLAICSTWLGRNCRILSITGVVTIACNMFLQAAFFAAALVLALRLAKNSHASAQNQH